MSLLRSTAATAVHQVAPGVYRVAAVGGGHLIARYVDAVRAARAGDQDRVTSPDTADDDPAAPEEDR